VGSNRGPAHYEFAVPYGNPRLIVALAADSGSDCRARAPIIVPAR
jgi:hypothetical protein